MSDDDEKTQDQDQMPDHPAWPVTMLIADAMLKSISNETHAEFMKGWNVDHCPGTPFVQTCNDNDGDDYRLVSCPLDDFCICIWIYVLIICLSTQITDRQGTAMY